MSEDARLNAAALEAAHQVEDILVQTHSSHTQRLARIQIAIREAMRKLLVDASA